MSEQLTLFDLFERPPVEALFTPDQIYESDDPALFVRLTEDARFDRKSGRAQPRLLAEYLSSFGNGPAIHGGVLAIGIENNGAIGGCKSLTPEQLHGIETGVRDYCADGRFTTRRVGVVNYAGEDDFLILMRIKFVDDKLVCLTDGSAFIREGDTNRRLGDHQKQEIRIDKGERSFELEPCTLSFPSAFNEAKISRFCQLIREDRGGSDEVSDAEILEIMHLGRRSADFFIANNACCLLFAKDPQTAIPGSYVHVLRYEGTEERSGREYNVSKDRTFAGTVLDVIRQTADFLDANFREFTEYRGGKFHSVPEYPRDAWYELLVNACVHRSYNLRNAPIFVKLFDDHFIVESPGGFMPQVTPETIYGLHRPRNPFLMLALREYGEVRCISEGTRRVRSEMNSAHLPPPEFAQETHAGATVRAILRNDIANRSNSLDSKAYEVLGEALAFTLSTDERKIINYVVESGRINVSEALRIMSTTYWHTAKARLSGLVSRGILDFVSKKQRDPNSYYVLAMRGPKNGQASAP